MRARIGSRTLQGLKPGDKLDDLVPGFHARRRITGAVFFCLHYRIEGRQRWYGIGQYGAPWTPDGARQEARRLLGSIVTGADPVGEKKTRRAALSISELCRVYVEDVEAGRVLTRNGRGKKALRF
jgi:Arm DNA-binding domain